MSNSMEITRSEHHEAYIQPRSDNDNQHLHHLAADKESRADLAFSERPCRFLDVSIHFPSRQNRNAPSLEHELTQQQSHP